MRFYVSTPGLHIRPRNTDWLYDRRLPQIAAFDPRVQVYLQRSSLRTLEFNVRFAAGILRQRTKLPIPLSLTSQSEYRSICPTCAVLSQMSSTGHHRRT